MQEETSHHYQTLSVSGVLLGYDSVKLKKNAAVMNNSELPHIHLGKLCCFEDLCKLILNMFLQATFFIFHPSPGNFLLGTVNKIGEGHVGLLGEFGIILRDLFTISVFSASCVLCLYFEENRSCSSVGRVQVISRGYSEV